MLSEARAESAVFDLPFSKCFFGSDGGPDLSVEFHGATAGTPLGPAAGPQSQMAQNLVLSWLAGCRVMELKTVQVLDQLEILRPCIDMATVGFNVEWSQELRLAQSLEEYVKGSMLIEILRASGEVPASVARGARLGDVIFDMSVGYDLAGVKAEPVQTFIRGMQDASEVVARLRVELLSEANADVLADYPQLAELEFTGHLSNTLTLSTFHGCPSDEIEGIAALLMRENGLDVVVKLNPTLLGPERVRELLNDELGYTDLVVPDKAFAGDTKWDEMTAFVARLGDLAAELGRGFGVKFTNTLIVENRRDFFPGSEVEMYLSGAPLHVLAMNLVARFREVFGARFPISFSAGIDRVNFADAVALGLVPVTVCTDLLRPGGYGRAAKYFTNLEARMAEVGARTIGDFVIRALGHGREALMNAWVASGAGDFAVLGPCEEAWASGTDLLAAAGPDLHAAWVRETALLNTADYVPRATVDARYGAAKNSRTPKKIGKHLDLFDCTTCDKCVPVCPNNANFVFELPALDVPIQLLRDPGGGIVVEEAGRLVTEKAKQYANFADFCNECGNCDVFCPEDGGPYVVKPRFFRTLADWELFAEHDGFALDGDVVRGRFRGRGFYLESAADGVRFVGAGFELELDPVAPGETVSGRIDPDVAVDLTYMHILIAVRDTVFAASAPNYLNMATA
jgi:putative selenate reductase